LADHPAIPYLNHSRFRIVAERDGTPAHEMDLWVQIPINAIQAGFDGDAFHNLKGAIDDLLATGEVNRVNLYCGKPGEEF